MLRTLAGPFLMLALLAPTASIGVTTVVDELAVVKDVKVIKPKPAVQVIETTTPATTEMKVIVKP